MGTRIVDKNVNQLDAHRIRRAQLGLRRFDSAIGEEFFRSSLASPSHKVPWPPRDTAA